MTTGPWLRRQPHWEWRVGDDWEPAVSSFVVESVGETVLLGPLAPTPSAASVYEMNVVQSAPPPTGSELVGP